MIVIYIHYILGECYNHRLLNQWPPVGKSSDTPKERKFRKTGRDPQGQGSPRIWGGMRLIRTGYSQLYGKMRSLR